jgi:putative molybdopterin biosynthesis protein
MKDLMNTKEAAKFLGIHEKKVYALAKAGRIPCTRVTGKWLFPKPLLDQWITESAQKSVQTRKKPGAARDVLLVAGSDDPSLGLLREFYAAGRPPATLYLATVGSTAGLDAVREGAADLALAHLRDPTTGEYNLPYLGGTPPAPVAIVPLFHRELGLVTRPGNPLGFRSVADLLRTGIRFVNRQEGSGTRLFLDQQLEQLGITPAHIPGYPEAVATHLEVGLSILRGEADVGLATQAAARLLGLDFAPLTQERFDLVIPKERFFTRGVQHLLEIVGSREFRARVEALGGYDASESGRILAPSGGPGQEAS